MVEPAHQGADLRRRLGKIDDPRRLGALVAADIAARRQVLLQPLRARAFKLRDHIGKAFRAARKAAGVQGQRGVDQALQRALDDAAMARHVVLEAGPVVGTARRRKQAEVVGGQV